MGTAVMLGFCLGVATMAFMQGARKASGEDEKE
jgi:hypothetical protein